MNVLTSHRRITIETLLSRVVGHREIERRIGVDRKTIPRYARLAQSPGVATGAERDDGQTPHPGHRLNRPSSPARGKGGGVTASASVWRHMRREDRDEGEKGLPIRAVRSGESVEGERQVGGPRSGGSGPRDMACWIGP